MFPFHIYVLHLQSASKITKWHLVRSNTINSIQSRKSYTSKYEQQTKYLNSNLIMIIFRYYIIEKKKWMKIEPCLVHSGWQHQLDANIAKLDWRPWRKMVACHELLWKNFRQPQRIIGAQWSALEVIGQQLRQVDCMVASRCDFMRPILQQLLWVHYIHRNQKSIERPWYFRGAGVQCQFQIFCIYV